MGKDKERGAISPQSPRSDAAANRELRVVQELLRAWARRNRRWRPDLGVAMMNYSRRTRGTIDSYAQPEDYDDRIEAVQLSALERAVEDDLQPAHRIAIRAIYTRETAPSRINGHSRADLVALCEQAELALIPALRRRNVLL